MTLPWLAAAVMGRCFPTMRWTWLLVICVSASIAAVIWPAAFALLILWDAMLVAVVSVDLALLWIGTGRRRARGISVTRTIPKTCSLGVHVDGELTLRNVTPMRLTGQMRDDLPEHFTVTPADHAIDLLPGLEMTTPYQMTPHRRGAFSLENVYMRLNSPLRFWNRYLTLPIHDALKVYPDMKQMSDYAMLARTNRLNLMGVRRTRRIGQDSDFERLRDYTPDDNYRHVDWRSTARRSKLTVRQFQSDQSQRLIFMLDCGRMMTNEHDGYTLLDHALNSALMLAYVALHQGDAVGMICFSDKIHAFIPPAGGKSQMNRLIQAGYDQFPRMVESRYDNAFLYLSSHCKRRSLVTLMTNVIDEVNATVVVDFLSNLTGTHLPLAVLLRDREMFEAADAPLMAHVAGGPAIDEFKMYLAAAASDILVWRHDVLTDLRHRGVLAVDAMPEDLTAPLINEYLKVKAKHLL